MLNLHELRPQDFVGLSPEAAAELAAKVLQHIAQQGQHIAQRDQQIESQAQAILFRDANIERITFELRRLKAWRFDAKTERMNAEQRQLFEETLAADQADLEARLAALKATAKETDNTTDPDTRSKPKRRALPEHLKRVDHHHEPENTTCGCGQAMVRIGEDVNERLDIIPAQFFAHRHIRGKWACKCRQTGSRHALVNDLWIHRFLHQRLAALYVCRFGGLQCALPGALAAPKCSPGE